MAFHQLPVAMPDSLLSDYESYTNIHLIIHLLDFGKMLCTQANNSTSALCAELRAITQGRAHLCLGRQNSRKKGKDSSSTLITLPVQFGHIVYGILCVTFDPTHTEQPSIPLPVAQLLAQVCSYLLYTIEQSSFLQGQCQQIDYHIHGPLTKREREVLTLMCQGYNQSAIAERLCISPATVGKHRQHIYEQLGVHCERDALLVAYQTGLFSIVEDY
jgi:DNA-binding CsgD family transcriptional regulator